MSSLEKHVCAFGPFFLDLVERQLLRDGEPVPLEPKVFDTLVLLIRNSGHLVEKDELIKKVWPDAFVEESSLTRNISTLRRALRDGENGLHYIQTVPRHGYRFVASVRDVADESSDFVNENLGGAHLIPEQKETYSRGKHERLDLNEKVTALGSRADTEVESIRELAFSTGELVPRPGAGYRVDNIRRYKNTAVVTAMGLALAITIITYIYLARSRQPALDSVAVLPFVNLSNDPSMEYLSDGISENLINNLSQLPQLKVIGRSSTFKYKGKEVDPQEVAEVLGVGAIVTGRIIQQGDNLQISVELINAIDKTQMWGEQYHRRASDLQTVQAEVARTVVQKMRVRLTGVQEQQLSKRATENAQAYQLYLTGVFRLRKQNLDGYKQALEYFDQAVALDPNFALAFASMPAVYANLAGTSGLDAKVAIAKGRVAAQKALQLDETLSVAHSGMAIILRYEWDWSGAEIEFKRAIELSPNTAGAHSGYSLYLAGMGRTAEALVENKIAQELDPLRITFKGNEGGILYGARRYDEAAQVFQNVIKLEPDYPFGHLGLAHSYVGKGMYEEAVKEYTTTRRLYGQVTNGLIDLGYVYAMSGKRDEAFTILNKLKTGKEYVSPVQLAILYAGLGDKEAAFQALERGYSTHDPSLETLKTDPRYDSLRGDPRFADVLRRMRLA